MAENKNNWENIIKTQETAVRTQFGGPVSEEMGVLEVDLALYRLLSAETLSIEQRKLSVNSR